MRLVMGDALHSLRDLGSGGLRLDANGFLGVEKSRPGPGLVGGPSAVAGCQPADRAAWCARWAASPSRSSTSPMDDIATRRRSAPTCPTTSSPVPPTSTRWSPATPSSCGSCCARRCASGVDPASLVHALQNHDELTYELVHFATAAPRRPLHLRRPRLTGARAAPSRSARPCVDPLTGEPAPYNLLFVHERHRLHHGQRHRRRLGITDLDAHHRGRRAAHPAARTCCCACTTRWQPGVFALSGWDLVGALPLRARAGEGPDRHDGDTRWIDRGAYDLLGQRPGRQGVARPACRWRGPVRHAARPARQPELVRLPAAPPSSKVRKRNSIATGTLVDVPEVSNKSMLVLVTGWRPESCRSPR